MRGHQLLFSAQQPSVFLIILSQTLDHSSKWLDGDLRWTAIFRFLHKHLIGFKSGLCLSHI